MYMFDNLIIFFDFKLPKNFGNCLPKKPCRIYVLRLSFCTLMLRRQFSQNSFPFYACKTGAFGSSFVCVLRCSLFI